MKDLIDLVAAVLHALVQHDLEAAERQAKALAQAIALKRATREAAK